MNPSNELKKIADDLEKRAEDFTKEEAAEVVEKLIKNLEDSDDDSGLFGLRADVEHVLDDLHLLKSPNFGSIFYTADASIDKAVAGFKHLLENLKKG